MTKIEELEKQVAEMKATIELMKAEKAKPKKFEFKYQEECYLLRIDEVDEGGGQSPSLIEHGRYRKSEEVAEQSLARNKRANRLEALAEYLGGLKEWEQGEKNYYVYLSGGSTIYEPPTWVITYTSWMFHPEKIYMTKECAKEMCRMLNEGEFEL